MRAAPILAILACGMAAAVWLRLAPTPEGGGLGPGIGLVTGSLIAGLLIDRGRRKAVLLTGLVVLSAGLWCMGRFPAALGLGVGITVLAANALMATPAAGNRASRFNLLGLLFPAGVLVTPVLPPETAGYAAPAIATLALCVAAWTPMPLPVPQPSESRPGLVPAALLLFLYAMCEAAVWRWLAPYMGAARVLDQETARLILLVAFPLGLILGRAGASRILLNVAPMAVVRVASFAMAFTTALMLLARSPSASWIAVFCLGVTMAPVFPTILAVACDTLPRSPVTGMGIVLAAGWIGLVVSSPLIAGIAQRSSLPAAMLLLPVASLGMGLLTYVSCFILASLLGRRTWQ